MTEKKFFINNAEEIIPLKNDSPFKRILAIGDVHAAFDKLTSLWKKLAVTDDDLVIFLGDYLYGLGDKNIETLHWLIEHKKSKNIIFLRGNVDETYLNHLFDTKGKLFTGINRGVAREIKIAAIKKPYFPQEIYNFLNDLPLYHVETIGGRNYIFCHAGINVGVPLDQQKKSHLLNHPGLLGFYRDYSGKDVIIVGHKSPKKISAKLPRLFASATEKLDLSKPIKVPGKNKNILMLDTHAKEEGCLSCVDILSGEFWQSSVETGNDSTDSIIFVCSGNSCRSPMAKYAMRHLLAQNNLSEKIFVDSAGCKTRGGGRMSQRARDVLRRQKIPFDKHVSKPFTLQEYNKFKCVVALDEVMLKLAKKISGGDPDKKIRLLTDRDGNKLNVDDPFNTGNYQKAYEAIQIGCTALCEELSTAYKKVR